jgi:thiamine biosynthesis lipoprotein
LNNGGLAALSRVPTSKQGAPPRRALVVWLVVLTSVVTACLGPPPRGSGEGSVHRVELSDGWLAMGTFFEAELRVRPGEVDRATEWLDWSRSEIARLERIYSRHDSESEVSRLNQTLAGASALDTGTRVAPELEALLFGGVEVWEGSAGAFDMTIGPLIHVWERAVAHDRWPALSELRPAKERVGSGRLLLSGDGKVEVTASGIRIDLDGISKGAVLDHLREKLLDSLPDVAALLSFGESSILALGDPDGEGAHGGWRLEVQSRSPGAGGLARIRLRDRALSVSSSVGSIRSIGGESVSHVIDPRTGSPVGGAVEAVVVAERGMIADGWSTALLVLGAQKNALRLVDKQGLDAFILESGGRNAATDGWSDYTIDP